MARQLGAYQHLNGWGAHNRTVLKIKPKKSDKIGMLCLFRIFFVVIPLLCSISFAPDDLSRFDGKVKLGMEIELLPEKLKNLVGFFDFSTIPRSEVNKFLEGLSSKDLNRYFDDWEQFDKLPQALQDELSQGLELKKVHLEIPKNTVIGTSIEIPSQEKPRFEPSGPLKLLAPNGEPHSKELILPNGQKGILLPDEKNNPTDLNKLLLMEIQTTFHTIKARWDALPQEKKIEAMDPNALPAIQRAQLMIEADGEGHRLQIKKDAPEVIREFFSRLTWHRDLDAMEFKHKDPLGSASDYEAQLLKFAEMAQVTRELNFTDPKGRGGVSYHLHVSVPKRSLEKRLEKFNTLLLLRLLNSGHRNLTGNFGYSDDLDEKGFVRLIDPSHVEIRIHDKAPSDSLREILNLVTENESAIQKSLDSEVDSLLTVENFGHLAQEAPKLSISLLNGMLRNTEKKSSSPLVTQLQKEVSGEVRETRFLDGLLWRFNNAPDTAELASFLHKNITDKFVSDRIPADLRTLMELSRFLALSGFEDGPVSSKKILGIIEKGLENGTISLAEIPTMISAIQNYGEGDRPKRPSRLSRATRPTALTNPGDKSLINDFTSKLNKKFIAYVTHAADKELDTGEYEALKVAIEVGLKNSHHHRGGERVEEVLEASRRPVNPDNLAMWRKIASRLNSKRMAKLLEKSPELYLPLISSLTSNGQKDVIHDLLPNDLEKKLMENFKKRTFEFKPLLASLAVSKELEVLPEMPSLNILITEKIGQLARSYAEAGRFSELEKIFSNEGTPLLREVSGYLLDLSPVNRRRLSTEAKYLFGYVQKREELEELKEEFVGILKKGNVNEVETFLNREFRGSFDRLAESLNTLSVKEYATVLKAAPSLMYFIDRIRPFTQAQMRDIIQELGSDAGNRYSINQALNYFEPHANSPFVLALRKHGREIDRSSDCSAVLRRLN